MLIGDDVGRISGLKVGQGFDHFGLLSTGFYLAEAFVGVQRSRHSVFGIEIEKPKMKRKIPIMRNESCVIILYY